MPAVAKNYNVSAAEAIIDLAHRLPEGQTRLPGLHKMEQILGISVPKLRTAIRHLVSLGVLKTVSGSGTYYLPEASSRSRLQTLEAAALIDSRHRRAPCFHVLCVPELLSNAIYAPMLIAIVNAFARRNQVVKIDTRPKSEWNDWVRKRRHLRGLLVVEFATPAMAKLLNRRGTPWVVLARVPEGVSAHAVTLDDRKLVTVALDHLHTLGHRRVAFVYPDLPEPAPKLRREGFEARCRELSMHGVLVPNDPIDHPVVRRILDAGCTAVVCQNDHYALQVMREANRLGVKAPAQLSVCGIDDFPEGAVADPSLTTVFYPRPMMGEWAVKMVNGLLAHPKTRKQQWVVPCEVLARQSTAAVAGASDRLTTRLKNSSRARMSS